MLRYEWNDISFNLCIVYVTNGIMRDVFVLVLMTCVSNGVVCNVFVLELLAVRIVHRCRRTVSEYF